jgi:glutamyl-Q tRNA(Asp) synthetase
MTIPQTTRFAPSPTGLLHSGHAYSALLAYDIARRTGGRFLVRIEDIDFTRCRREYEVALLEDLAWLGMSWQQPVRRQSDHLPEYAAAVQLLKDRGLLYPCFCTRREILREIEAAGGAPQGPEGPVYPGTCRHLTARERESRIASGESFALRLDTQKSRSRLRDDLTWHDELRGVQIARPEMLGDVVLVRRDIGCSYHLAVVFDDALQEVSLVTRGEDLFEATHLHRLLQALLGLPTPRYHHHPLLRDDSGRRLAKRDQSETLRSLRERGLSPADIRRKLEFAG